MVNIPKSGGSNTTLVSGGFLQPLQVSIDPDKWVETLFRAFQAFVESKIDTEIYDLRFSFPSANDLGILMPLNKTIIHFEMDNITNPTFGIGRNVVAADYDDINKTITEWEALEHELNYDVGVWASARSGGVTARLRAYQVLNDLFAGARAFFDLQEIGIEIKSFNGAAFHKEELNDVEVFRIANMTLVICVYSRRAYMTETYIDSVVQDQELKTADDISVS